MIQDYYLILPRVPRALLLGALLRDVVEPRRARRLDFLVHAFAHRAPLHASVVMTGSLRSRSVSRQNFEFTSCVPFPVSLCLPYLCPPGETTVLAGVQFSGPN